MGSTKKILKQISFQAHKLALRAGLIVLPTHFYVPYTNIIELEKTKHLWAKKSELPGMSSDLDEQAETLKHLCLPYQKEYAGNEVYKEAVRRHFGPGYGYIEAQALHGLVRHYRPSRIIEVGSGVSTYCSLKALDLNEREIGRSARITCIEPYPSDALRSLKKVELIETQVQEVSSATFEELDAGDLLFIDSTHTVRPASDVSYLILEVLPRLPKGVIVHFHDIYLPYDYQRDVLQTYFQWMETSLLRAYLTHNERVRTVFCLSQLHYDRQGVLKYVFPKYNPASDDCGLEVQTKSGEARGHFPCSIYIETI
jgi:hypothetical protein